MERPWRRHREPGAAFRRGVCVRGLDCRLVLLMGQCLTVYGPELAREPVDGESAATDPPLSWPHDDEGEAVDCTVDEVVTDVVVRPDDSRAWRLRP